MGAGADRGRGGGRFADRKSMTGLLVVVLLFVFGIYGMVRSLFSPVPEADLRSDFAQLRRSFDEMMGFVPDSLLVPGDTLLVWIDSAGAVGYAMKGNYGSGPVPEENDTEHEE